MSTVNSSLDKIRQEALQEVREAATIAALEQVRIKYLGKKGAITALMKEMGSLSPEERPAFGAVINQVKQDVETSIEECRTTVRRKEREESLRAEAVDITLPGYRRGVGTVHPLNRVCQDIIDTFTSMGFSVAEGPEVELDFYNFESLNFPPNHPARDMQDTFFISEDVVLRTHTSPVQIRVMERCKPPVKIIAPGKVYRCDADVTHTPMFHQIEGLLVDEKVTFSDLKGTLEFFIHRFFGPETGVRFRPSFFPFTEPSAEVDIQCVICGGKGCRVCKGTGWLEILGAGMVHPNVFRSVGYDPEEVTGFAFGMGIERITMLRYRIDDIRVLFENDLRFLRQF
ncbi:MAG: phenylalanine--tRNA ligase subunit alpha [Nitrospirota bacterium]|nr:phenylalanine--tRNA ligase subunit alpha [Nitrospirota bacterium]